MTSNNNDRTAPEHPGAGLVPVLALALIAAASLGWFPTADLTNWIGLDTSLFARVWHDCWSEFSTALRVMEAHAYR